MIVLLDKNIFVTYMREPLEFQKFGQLIATSQWTTVFMSSITLFELEVGIVGRQSETIARARLSAILRGPIQVEALDNRAARLGAQIAARSRSVGMQLSATDAMIAGHAFALNASLVTNGARLAAAVTEVDVLTWY